MKILFITSGYTGIYPYFEQSIQESLSILNHLTTSIAPEYTNETLTKIEEFQPDLVLAIVGYKIPDKLLLYLQQKGYVLGIWFTEDPYYLDESLRLAAYFQFVFTNDLGAYEYYQSVLPSKHIYQLPLGTDPSMYAPSTIKEHVLYDLCLIGYPYPERVQLIQHILAYTDFSIIIAGPLWRKFIDNKYPKRVTIINKWIEPEYVKQIFHSSAIILNPHRTYDFSKNKNSRHIQSKSINNRTFDIAACGGFQLIPVKPDLSLHFDVTNEMVTYSSDENCIQLIYQFMNDPDARNSISDRAMKRVLNNHTFFHRVQQILNSIK